MASTLKCCKSGTLILVLGSISGLLQAQDDRPSTSLPKSGFQIRTVSFDAAYYSKTLPNGGFQPGTAALPADVSGGASASFGWTKFSDRTAFSLNYTSAYTGHVRYSSLNTLQHSLSITTNRKIAPRWNLGLSAGGNLSSVEQFLFSSNGLSRAASVPSTFDDLAAGLLAAKFTNNPQLGTVLTSAPLVESPLGNLLYGQRMLTTSASAFLSYTYSPRLSMTFSGGASRAQQISDDRTRSASSSYLLDTTSGSGGVAISYSLSPHAQLGGTVTSSRIVSSVQDAYTTTSLASLGRTVGKHWVMQIHGGVGVTTPVRQTSFRISTTPLPAAGGSLGFKTFEHTILGSFDHTVSDSYGLGAASSSTANATWQWRRPGREWWIESSLGWQQLGGNALATFSGWHTSAGLGRQIGRHLALFTQYAYLDYVGVPQQRSASSLSQSAVRVSLVWSPNGSNH